VIIAYLNAYLLWELLYADDLVVIPESKEKLMNRLHRWKG